MLPELENKNCDIESLVDKGINSKKVLTDLLEAIQSKKETIRYNSFKVLNCISEIKPRVLYPYWDDFTKLLSSEKALNKHAAIYIIANLTLADKQKKFEKIFNHYYKLLNDTSIIPPSHVALNSAVIVNAKPELEPKITNKLLAIDKTDHEEERKDLIKSYIIEAFEQYYEKAKSQKRIIKFVEDQLESRSPKTRKKAKQFLERYL